MVFFLSALSLAIASSTDAFIISHIPSTSTRPYHQWRPNHALEERRSNWLLCLASSADSNAGEAMIDGVDSIYDNDHEDFDMPWGDLQSFALRDNLPKYVVTIPIPGKKDKYGTFALWRSLLKECTELAGYEVEFVRRRYEVDVKTREEWKEYRIGTSDAGGSAKEIGTAPRVLPLLESFEFHPDGGVTGMSYGIPGIADGSSIRTTAVTDIETTVIMGYIQTADGSAAYELGSPAGNFYPEDTRRNMLENAARAASTLIQSGVAGATEAGKLVATNGAGAVAGAEGEIDSNLVNLAGTTAMLLAGASAVGMLSHHLTVNVFWV
jgi:hypothetical protein